MEKKDKLQYIKVIISACLMVGASMGLCFYASGVFYEPLSLGLQISLGEASMMTMFMLIFMAMTALLVPGVIRRFPFQYVLLAGTALCAGSVIAISFCFNRFWIYLFASLMGCGAALIGPVTATSMINNWFEQKKSWTTSVVLAGSALSAAILTPLMSAVTTALGWRMGFVIQSILVLVLMLPALLWQIPLSPYAAGAKPYGVEDAEPVHKNPNNSILGMFAIMAVLSACLIALPMHYSTLATSIGRASLVGAQMLSWAMIGNLLFKLLGGLLSDKLKAVLASGVLDIIAMIGTIGILICLNVAGSDLALKSMAFFSGSVFALSELSLPLFVSHRFARKHYTTVYALLNFLSTLTTALAIPLVGFLYDAMKSYVWIYVIALILEAVICLLIWYLLHDKNADELVKTPSTRTFVEKIRESTQKRRDQRVVKAQERKAKQEQEKAEKEAARQEQAAKDMAAAAAASEAAPAEDDSDEKAENPVTAAADPKTDTESEDAEKTSEDKETDSEKDETETEPAEDVKEVSKEEKSDQDLKDTTEDDKDEDLPAVIEPEPEKPAEEKKPSVNVTVTPMDSRKDSSSTLGFDLNSMNKKN